MSDHDPDDRHSPGLQPFKPIYGPREETPPPFAVDPAKQAIKPSGEEGTDCSQPNRPDIAYYERTHPIRRDDGPDLPPIGVKVKPFGTRPERPPDPDPQSPFDIAHNALQLLLQKNHLSSPPPSAPPDVHPKDPPKDPPQDDFPKDPPKMLLQEDKSSPSVTLQPPPKKSSPKEPSHLSMFMISNPQGPSTLPALDSPGNSNTHTLPPLQAALSGLPDIPGEPHPRVPASSPYALPPVIAASPPALRTESSWELQRPTPYGGPSPQIPLSPYSHLSPASATDLSAVSSPVSHHSYRRMPLKAEIPYINSSPYEAVHPTKSPATSYPTPTDQQTPAGATPYSQPPSSSAVAPTGTYKCSHTGCNAPPFQTQYLLNSHAKVHSQDRPHFCPVDGCPRALGGKGFKRKNEMIRHGLVHNSPGYVCPFCPDQQHKYPRPDNLQRHVRVHHVDKNKDDPLLRQVLSQRPEGSSRGRRRRTNGP